MQTGKIVPLALEYVFWDERLPVCLAKFGPPIDASKQDKMTKQQWGAILTQQLRDTQDQLAQLATARSSDPFESLMAGRIGAGMLYDSFRRAKSLLTGNKFEASHGEQFK